MFRKRFTWMTLLTCALASSSSFAQSEPAKTPAPEKAPATGSVSGSVTLEDRGEALVVVYLEKVPGSAKPSPSKAAKITQRGTRFTPGAIVVTKGSRVQFPNEDKFYHNVFSVTQGSEFDLGMYRGGASKSTVLAESGEVAVYCNIHPDMEARVLVVDNDFYVQAKDGAYTLDGLPSGEYTLVAWAAGREPAKKKITVEPGKKAKVDFALKAMEKRGHMNKHGEQYGRYR